MSGSPAFQTYVNDFLGSPKVGVMSVEEFGAYWFLLFLDWQEGGFVFNEDRLAKWCRMSTKRFRKAWDNILSECFVEHDGRFWSPRLERERTKQADWREKSAKGGKASGEARAKGGSATPGAPSNTPLPLPLPLPSPGTTKDQTTTDMSDGADELVLIELPTTTAPTAVTQAECRRQKQKAADTEADANLLSDPIMDMGTEPEPTTGTSLSSTPKSKSPRDADVRQVLDRYKEIHPRRTVTGPRPRVIVERALKSGRTADELIEAIEGNAADPWHKSITKHELSYILRDDEQIDKAIALKHAPGTTSRITRRNAPSPSWLARYGEDAGYVVPKDTDKP
jgi:uncharacterized protein YdaU (DUF1376 family)